MPLTISTLIILTTAHHDPDSPEPAPIMGMLKRAVPTAYTEHRAATAHKADMAARNARLKRLETELHTTPAPSRAMLVTYEAELKDYNLRKEPFDASRPSNPVFLAALARCAHDVAAQAVYIADPVLLLSLALSFDHLGSRAARDALLALLRAMGPLRANATLGKLSKTILVKPSVAQLSFMMPYL
ncbi:uncharacterized protein LOC62_06G008046 [Vanrija pseudolonga]|uniref:Uncharacterized protein n=1 Tax=Vanrija pseudolonga TaxID=143232 RepID=A0AAF0YGD2_9TREE|nr:hypothetical protein LOC62_06G008046 [Vanrija pseudolonga]